MSPTKTNVKDRDKIRDAIGAHDDLIAIMKLVRLRLKIL